MSSCCRFHRQRTRISRYTTKKANNNRDKESRYAPICENISYRQKDGEQAGDGCGPPHRRRCHEMQQPNVVDHQMMLLGMLSHMGDIICKIDTCRDDAGDIPKDDFEAFLAHFRSVEETRGKHQQVRIVQIRLIGHICCYCDVLGNTDGFAALG